MKQKKQRTWNIPPAIRHRILAESRALHVSPEEYLTIATKVAESIRGAVFPEGIKDSTMLKSIVQNPLMLQMASALAATLWNQLQTSQDGESAKENNTTQDISSSEPAATITPTPNTTQQPRQSQPIPSLVVIDPMTGQRIRIPPHAPLQ